MEYSKLPIPEHHNGGELYLHCVDIFLEPVRKEELEQFLQDSFGPKHVNWRVQYQGNRLYWKFRDSPPMPLKVRFKTRNDAMRFKLSWQPCPVRPFTIAPSRPGELVIFGTGIGKSIIR